MNEGTVLQRRFFRGFSTRQILTLRATCLLWLLWLVLLGSLLTLVACGKNSTEPQAEKDVGVNVTGTLTLPAEAPGKWYAVAVDSDTSSANGFAKVITGTCGTGLRVTYEMKDVPAGTYYVYAVVWVVSTPLSAPTSGDYVGFYGTQGTIPSAPNASVPSSGRVTFDITLVVLP
ncbi:MAG: hypothetical protein ONB14_07215 [candidate division KSB1 bacterium]|nr:hypothetical protein [candidate division KSB1 bacterium]MDZ7378203.1 hypothetical protein [candidate division KSB1 bacterium]MDZ7385027.1 hypothetical protein [candidate division KSB1 bacterium]MDZ7393366.1 hypothetical protein [candidate division KSB1 bacterium]MDZ7414299.1 hypothetical protein [candidate division KSB1 bacterium]